MRFLLILMTFIFTVSAEKFEVRAKKEKAPIFAKSEDAAKYMKESLTTSIDKPLRPIAWVGSGNIDRVYYISEIAGVFKITYLNVERDKTSIGYVSSSTVEKVRLSKKVVYTPRNVDKTPIFFEDELLKEYEDNFSVKNITEVKMFLEKIPDTIASLKSEIQTQKTLVAKRTSTIQDKDSELAVAAKKHKDLIQEKNSLSIELEQEKSKSEGLTKKGMELNSTIDSRVEEIKGLEADIVTLNKKAQKDEEDAKTLLYASLGVVTFIMFMIGLVVGKATSKPKKAKAKSKTKQKNTSSSRAPASLSSTRSGIDTTTGRTRSNIKLNKTRS